MKLRHYPFLALDALDETRATIISFLPVVESDSDVHDAGPPYLNERLGQAVWKSSVLATEVEITEDNIILLKVNVSPNNITAVVVFLQQMVVPHVESFSPTLQDSYITSLKHILVVIFGVYDGGSCGGAKGMETGWLVSY